MKQVAVVIYGDPAWIVVSEQVVKGNVTTRGEVYYDTRPQKIKDKHSRAAYSQTKKMDVWSKVWWDVDVKKELPEVIIRTIFRDY